MAKMKDGRTHLAHKAEHAVDLSSGALLATLLEPAIPARSHRCSMQAARQPGRAE